VGTDRLLCELHAHSTWSDGALTVTELVDLYGFSGFDVLCLTDHVLRTGASPYRLRAETHDAYIRAIEREAKRALEQYGLLLIPGMELTHVAESPDDAGHALAVGLRSFVSVDDGLEAAMRAARTAGAAIVAAHPHGERDDPNSARTTRFFTRNWDRLDGLVDRYELFNRAQAFGWVACAGLPGIATGDFHRPEHLESWKTLLPCEKTERAVVQHLRSDGPAHVVPWHLRPQIDRRRVAA
jgi:predicted metal-dependent phosphoesterase TrpH